MRFHISKIVCNTDTVTTEVVNLRTSIETHVLKENNPASLQTHCGTLKSYDLGTVREISVCFMGGGEGKHRKGAREIKRVKE